MTSAELRNLLGFAIKERDDMAIEARANRSWLDDFEPPEYLVAAWQRQMQDVMNSVLRRHGLKLVEWRILQCVGAEPNLTICDLSERAVVDRTVTGRLIDKLAEQGLVNKATMKGDRRFAQITLLDAGRSLLDVCNSDVAAIREMLFDGLSANEMIQLNATLQKLRANALRVTLRG